MAADSVILYFSYVRVNTYGVMSSAVIAGNYVF